MAPRSRMCLKILMSLFFTVLPIGSQAVIAQVNPSPLLIAEFRTRGPNGKFDEFVKIYNNTDSPYTVQTTDGSAGFALCALSGSSNSLGITQRFTIPNGTVIPARGFYLGALAITGGSAQGYGLSDYALPDIVYGTDIDDDRGIALFDSAASGNWTLAHRLDAVGFNNSAAAAAQLSREGTALASAGNANGQYSWVRKIDKESMRAIDTNNNAADFQFISNNGGMYNGVLSVLGYPGPQNLNDPNERGSTLIGTLIPDGSSPTGFKLNTRDLLDTGTNKTFGTLTGYRRITNSGTETISKLRFRVVEMTTKNSPLVCGAQCPQSDIRYLSSGIVPSGNPKGTKIEKEADQGLGGGVNTSGNVEGVLDLGANPLLPGQFVDVEFVLGVETKGYFRFFVSVEGKGLPAVPLAAVTSTTTVSRGK